MARLTGPEPLCYDLASFTADGARLIAGTQDARAAYVWDLRAIRTQLRGLGLDWELPEFPPAPPPGPPPAVVVDRGIEAHEGDYPNAREAVALFSVALALRPLNPEAHLQRGRALGRLGRPRQAVADYNAFLALAGPGDPRRAEALFRRSTNHAKLKDRAAALRDMLEVAAQGVNELPWPEQAAARCNDFAWELVKGPVEGRPAGQALVLARAAVALCPDSGWYGNTLGVALYRLGRWREAADVLEGNVGKFPEIAAADFYFLAMCYQRLGERERAREHFGRAVRWEEGKGARLAKGHQAELRALRSEAEALGLSTGR